MGNRLILQQHLNMNKMSAIAHSCKSFSKIHGTSIVVSSLWTKHGYTATPCYRPKSNPCFNRQIFSRSFLKLSRNYVRQIFGKRKEYHKGILLYFIGLSGNQISGEILKTGPQKVTFQSRQRSLVLTGIAKRFLEELGISHHL